MTENDKTPEESVSEALDAASGMALAIGLGFIGTMCIGGLLLWLMLKLAW
jgi:hypothetical protein